MARTLYILILVEQTPSGSSRSEVFFGKGVLKICSKLTGEHSCRSAISIKLQSNFIEIALWHGCSRVNLLHFFGTPFQQNTSKWLLLLPLNFAVVDILFLSVKS